MRHVRATAVAVCAAAVITAGGATPAHAETAHQHQDAAAHAAATPSPSPVDHSQPMPGMDHGIPAAPAATAAASAAASPSEPVGHTGAAAHSEASGGGEHGAAHGEDEPEAPRPRGLVIGGFAALNGAVVATAGFLRRRARLQGGRPTRLPRAIQ